MNERLSYIEGSKEYYISENGNVYKKTNDDKYTKLKQYTHKSGYNYISITMNNNKKKGFRVHRLVAVAFVENKNIENFTVVGHKDNDKTNNIYTNLYWTTTQENTQKAVDDKLLLNPNGIDNNSSYPILVTDLNDSIVAVYGSIREASRYIENVSVGYISRMLPKNLDYIPRNKKYKYKKISEEEYNSLSDKFKKIKLVEEIPKSKAPKKFKATNILTGEEIISDNQKQFATDHNISQALISKAIRTNGIYDNWRFELLEILSYTSSTSYDKLIETYDDIKVINIDTGEVLEFKTKVELKDYFGLKLNSLRSYTKRGNLILGKWKVIK